MAEIDQRSGTDRRSADGRSGIHTGFSLGRTALTGWALTAVIGLAGFGTALDVTPVRVADSAPLGAVGTVVRGSAPAVDPRTPVQVGRFIGPVAVAGDTLPLGVVGPMDTVTAASVPTPATAPTNTAPTNIAPAPGPTDLSVGGAAPTPAATVPAGPAAQLRQAAFTAAAPDQRAGLAIRTALAQIGLPYVWGGDGPTNGDAGFDCSGLTTFSYGSAGVLLPRTAHTQYNAGPHVPGGAPLQPGDLVFYGTSARVHHVGMYLGAGRMVNAPTFGKPVQVAFYRYRGDDYLGATRPAAAGGSLTTGLLPYVDPLPAVPDVALAPAQQQQQAQERVFQAPVASLPAVLPQPGDAALPPEPQSAAQSIAESDAVTGGTVRVVPRAVVAPATVDAPAGTAPSGPGSAPVGGTTTSSSAPVTPSPTAAPTSTAAAPAGNTTAPGPSAPVPSSPVGSASSASSTIAAPAAPASPPTTQSPTTVVEKATGSTTATTTLAPTSTVRTTTPKATTSKVATPVAPKTTTPSAVKTVTSPSTTAKAVTTTNKPAATTEDDDPTTTKTSAPKTSRTKTTEQKTSERKTSEEKTSAKKTTEEESSSSDEDD